MLLGLNIEVHCQVFDAKAPERLVSYRSVRLSHKQHAACCGSIELSLRAVHPGASGKRVDIMRLLLVTQQLVVLP